MATDQVEVKYLGVDAPLEGRLLVVSRDIARVLLDSPLYQLPEDTPAELVAEMAKPVRQEDMAKQQRLAKLFRRCLKCEEERKRKLQEALASV